MSVYGKQMEFLAYVERMQSDHTELTFRFACRCVCESTYPKESPYPRWRVHRFSTIPDVRQWIERHKGHECYVSLQTEGIRPKERVPSPTRREGKSQRAKVLEKLKALAEGTPYVTEADAALRKIRELESRCATLFSEPGRNAVPDAPE